MKRLLLLLLLGLSGCASQTLHAGKQDFDQGNYQSAMQKMLPLAEKGNADAEYAVGYMQFYGKGTPMDRHQGLEWIQKAAAQGLPEAVDAQKMLEKQIQLNPLVTK
jgi:TPR repeat protein